jgi:hypothetical protein
VALVFEPGRSLLPVALVATLWDVVPVRAVVFIADCSAEDLSAPACWARWEDVPWNVAWNASAVRVFPRIVDWKGVAGS